MSIGAITGSGSTANLYDALAVLRAGRVAAAQAVGPRLGPLDYSQVSEGQAQARQEQTAEAQARADQRRERTAGRGSDDGERSSRPSSAFLTQALAQEQDATAASTAAASSATYAQSAYSSAVGRSSRLVGRETPDIVLPSRPTLSSGRSLDLSV